MYMGGLNKKKILYGTGAKISRKARPIFHSIPNTTKIPSYLGGWGMYLQECVVARGYGRISGGTRALELAAESREASLGYGARSTSTSLLTLSRPKEDSTTPLARRAVAMGGAARPRDELTTADKWTLWRLGRRNTVTWTADFGLVCDRT
jgi:hypothetical protein